MTGASKNGMQPTLIRFDPEVLGLVKAEADRCGVSVAQFVREAALARVAYTAGVRGDRRYDAALAAASQNGRGSDRARDEVGSENQALRAESRQIVKQTARRRAEGQARRDR